MDFNIPTFITWLIWWNVLCSFCSTSTYCMITTRLLYTCKIEHSMYVLKIRVWTTARLKCCLMEEKCCWQQHLSHLCGCQTVYQWNVEMLCNESGFFADTIVMVLLSTGVVDLWRCAIVWQPAKWNVLLLSACVWNIRVVSSAAV